MLVVDDDPLFRTLCKASLEPEAEVTVAADGHNAVSFAIAKTPTAMVLDGTMPGWDGSQVLRAIRADASLDAMPVLMLTSSETPEQIAALKGAGADGFLAKADFTRESLRAMVSTLQPSRERAPRHEVRRVVPVNAFGEPA